MLRNLYKIIIVLGLILSAGLKIHAQDNPRYVAVNLPGFDQRKYHFGFTIGLNRSDFTIHRTNDTQYRDSLLTLENTSLPGFILGIVSTYRFTKNVAVRFIPSLSFQDRKLNYTFETTDSTGVFYEKIVESTFVEFPVLFKFRTNRIGNFAAYTILGGKYMIDMSSKKDVESIALKDLVVKTKKNQLAAEVGFGMDFFLPYFKFGIELKMGIGVSNVLIKENHKFDEPLDKLFPKSYIFALTFEG